jgi:hypothetical protein
MNKKEDNLQVHVQIISESGHDDWYGTPLDAIDMIKEKTNNESKWLFIDQQFRSPNGLSVADVIGTDIVLTNALAGG